MDHTDVKDDGDPEQLAAESLPDPVAPTPEDPAPGATAPRAPEPCVRAPSGEAPAPPASAISGAPPGAASATDTGPASPTPSPAPAPAVSEPAVSAAAPEDEKADLVRVGQVGSGRRLMVIDEDTLQSIRSFACDRPLPGLGTLLDLARAHATSGRGPGLGVEVFSEVRSQLGRIVADIEAIAIHVGPVLFLKTSAKNQPGTALRWLNEDERRALREHPELLDHPGRLTARLKKLLVQEAETGNEPDED